jgi:hypothetical protein
MLLGVEEKSARWPPGVGAKTWHSVLPQLKTRSNSSSSSFFFFFFFLIAHAVFRYSAT